MTNPVDKLQNIKVFVEVAKRRSFADSAESLGLSAPAVTRAIAALELQLRVKLFNRTTRRVQLTESGTRFFHDAERILEALDEAEAAAAGVYTNPAGLLTVTAPVLFGQKHIVPVVTEYLAQYPDVSVRAMFYDEVTNLIEEKLDVAIRIGHLKDSSLYATRVGQVRRVVCAAPDYFKRRGKPAKPRDLADHDIIFPTTFENTIAWTFNHKGKRETVRLTPRLHCSQNAAALAAAIDGFGITRLMSYQIGDELEQGLVSTVLEEYEEAPLPVNVIHLEGRHANARTRIFVDLAIERLRDNPSLADS